MAYAFNNIMGMMDKDRQNQGSSNPQSSMSQGLQKNTGSDEGAMSASGGTSNTAANKAPEDFTKSNFNSARTVLDRNKGVQQTGIENRLTADAQQKAQQNISNINKSSNEYLQNQTKKAEDLYKTPDKATVNNAVYGNNDAYSSISNTLNNAPGQVEDWQTPELQSPEAQEYTRANDVTNLLLKQGGQDYNKGMAALDNLQFKQTGGNQRVNQQVNDLQNRVSSTLDSAKDKQFGVQANAQKALDARAKQVQDAIRNMLGGSQNDIRAGVTSRLNDLDQNVHNQAKEASNAALAGFQSKIDNARDTINSRLGSEANNRDALQNVLNQFDSLRAGNYVDQVLPRVGFDTAVNQQEAERLNRINDLLGVKDRITSTGGNPVGTANVRSDAFNQEFNRIMAMLPPAQQAAIAANPAQQSANQLADASQQRVVNSLPGQQVQPANRDVQQTINQMLGVNTTPTRKPSASYNPFSSIGY